MGGRGRLMVDREEGEREDGKEGGREYGKEGGQWEGGRGGERETHWRRREGGS